MRRCALAAIVISFGVGVGAGCSRKHHTCDDLGPAIDSWGQLELAGEQGAALSEGQKQHARELIALARGLYPRVCKADKWSVSSIDCIAISKTEDEAQKCPMSKDQLEGLQKALMEELDKGTAGPTPPLTPPTPPAPPPAAAAIPECDAYAKAVAAFAACEKAPMQVRDMAKQQLANLEKGWAMLADPNVPAAQRQTAADACKFSASELALTAREMGCAP